MNTELSQQKLNDAVKRCDESCSAARREYQSYQDLYNDFAHDLDTHGEKLGILMRKTESAIETCKAEIAQIEKELQ